MYWEYVGSACQNCTRTAEYACLYGGNALFADDGSVFARVQQKEQQTRYQRGQQQHVHQICHPSLSIHIQ